MGNKMKSLTSVVVQKNQKNGLHRTRLGYGGVLALCVIFVSQTVLAQSSESKSVNVQRNDTISNQGFSIQSDAVKTQPVAQVADQSPVATSLNSPKIPSRNQIEQSTTDTDLAMQVQDEHASVKRLPRRLTGVAGKQTQDQSASVPWYRTGIGALSIVLCLMVGLYFMARKWVPSIRVADSRAINVVARSAITPKHQAALIQIGRRFVLVGISGEQMTTLCEVTNPEEIAELTTRVGLTQSPHATGFENVLSRETEGYVEPAVDPMMETLPGADPHQERRTGWLKTPALSELKNKLRSLQRRSS